MVRTSGRGGPCRNVGCENRVIVCASLWDWEGFTIPQQFGHFPAVQLDKFTGILLELPARHRESSYSGLLVEYSPQWVSLGGPCPSHRIRFMRGSARPFVSERNCWLR